MKFLMFILFVFYLIMYELDAHAKEPTVVKFNIRIKRPEKISNTNENVDARRTLELRRSRQRTMERNMVWIKPQNASDTLNYPYIAAIVINGRLWCAGAIVDISWVLTAAHCLNYVLHVSPMKSLRKYVKVRVGSTSLDEDGALIDVVGAIRHPKFEEEPVPHADIALLKLSEDLVFSKYVGLIKIYQGIKEPYAQSFITLTGWGAARGDIEAFRDKPSKLQSIRLKVRTQHYCADAYQGVNGFQFTNDFFCASLRNGTKDACLFDAGSPAIQKNQLVGVMSFGPEKCGQNSEPAVFIKSFYFRDFVKHTIRAYKTRKDIMEAMHDFIPRLTPPIHRPTVPSRLRGGYIYDDRSSEEIIGPKIRYI